VVGVTPAVVVADALARALPLVLRLGLETGTMRDRRQPDFMAVVAKFGSMERPL